MRKLLKRKQRRLEYDDDHVSAMLKGTWFRWWDGFGHYRRGPNETALRTAWECLRDDLLPEYIALNLGARPWAWWRYDAPDEGRRRVPSGYTATHPDAPEHLREHPDKPCFGIFTIYGTEEDDAEPVWESQAEFLKRHSLLSADELASIERRRQEGLPDRDFRDVNVAPILRRYEKPVQ